MKKILLLTAATMMLFACKSNQNEPEQPQQEPMTQKQAMQTYFGSPVALNGTFVETSNAILYATESQSASTPARAKSEGEKYPIINWTPQDGTWPIDLSVDYGAEGVIASDGLEHSGRMAITYSVGPVSQTLHLSFLLDKDGIVPNSVKPVNS